MCWHCICIRYVFNKFNSCVVMDKVHTSIIPKTLHLTTYPLTGSEPMISLLQVSNFGFTRCSLLLQPASVITSASVNSTQGEMSDRGRVCVCVCVCVCMMCVCDVCGCMHDQVAVCNIGLHCALEVPYDKTNLP